MAKNKTQKAKAVEALKPLNHETRVQVLIEEGFTEQEQAEVLLMLKEHDDQLEMQKLKDEDDAINAQALTQTNGIEDAEIVEEKTAEAAAPPPPPAPPAPAPVADQPEQPKHPRKGHPVFEEVQLYRDSDSKRLEEGRVIKTVSMEADRAERLNYQSANTLIRYRPVK